MNDVDLDVEDPADYVDVGRQASTEFAGPIEWFESWLLQVMRGADGRWCGRWWAHEEAVSRITTLWMAWEVAWQAGGAAPSNWWTVDHAHHWARLTSASGPFGACTPENCKGSGRFLAWEPPPDELKEAIEHAH